MKYLLSDLCLLNIRYESFIKLPKYIQINSLKKFKINYEHTRKWVKEQHSYDFMSNYNNSADRKILSLFDISHILFDCNKPYFDAGCFKDFGLYRVMVYWFDNVCYHDPTYYLQLDWYYSVDTEEEDITKYFNLAKFHFSTLPLDEFEKIGFKDEYITKKIDTVKEIVKNNLTPGYFNIYSTRCYDVYMDKEVLDTLSHHKSIYD